MCLAVAHQVGVGIALQELFIVLVWTLCVWPGDCIGVVP